MLECRPDKNSPDSAAACSSHTVNEPPVLTDDGIRQWAREQESYAKGISHGDPRRRGASLMLSYLGRLFSLLVQPASATLQQQMEKRRQELLREFRLEWHELKPTAEPPVTLLNAKAERQAYAETRSDIMALVQRIIALRRQLASPGERRRIHYRPVKRLR